MSSGSDVAPLGDMYDYARKVATRLEHVSREDFDANDDLRFAIVHWLQIIGEAARRVSTQTQDTHPEIAWTEIKGMRHRIVHDYTRVDFDRVWTTATKDVHTLIEALSKIVPPDPR
jgi:uncharacterized protein with HEPN domain